LPNCPQCKRHFYQRDELDPKNPNHDIELVEEEENNWKVKEVISWIPNAFDLGHERYRVVWEDGTNR